MIANNNKNKPVIQDVIISQEKMDEFNSELESSTSDKNKRGVIKKYPGGTCIYCGIIATKILKFDVGDGDDGDGTLIERYCDKCYLRWVEGKDKVRLTATNGIDETIAVRGEKNSHLGA